MLGRSASVRGLVGLIAAAVAGGGCAAATGSGGSSPDPPNDRAPARRAPGVAVDPATVLPAPVPEAQTGSGLVVLHQPRDRTAARDVVGGFFEAVTAESLADVEETLDDGARIRTSARGRHESASSSWRRRLQRLDYTTLAGQLVFRPSEVEIYSASEISALRSTRSLPLTARGEDVLIRVPIVSRRRGAARLFGDEVIFLLRPTPRGYKIVEMAEDFRLP